MTATASGAHAVATPARALRGGPAPAAMLALMLAWPGVAPPADAAPRVAADGATSGATLYVDVGWSGAAAGEEVAAGRIAGLNAFSTIQAAVDAALPGATVNVAAGTYVEQVIIAGKDLTLAGAGAGVTTIQSPGLLQASFTAAGFTNRPVMLCRNAADIRVRDLTVDGASQGDLNNRFVGVAYFNAGGLLFDIEVIGVRNAPLDNAQHGFGVYCQTTDGGPYTLELDGVAVSDFQKSGMLLNGVGMTVDVHDCTITGSGNLFEIAQNGIQLGSGAGGSIRDCALSNLRYVHAIAVSGAILVYQPGAPVTLSGFTGANAFSNVQSPIRWYDGDGSIDGVEVTGPIVEFQDYGPIAISNFSGPQGALSAMPAGATDGPPPAEPVVEPVAIESAGFGVLRTMSAKSVDIRNLCLSGSDVPGTTGLYLFSTGGPLTVTVTGAVLHDWDYGIRVVGAGTALAVSSSSIASNVTAGLENAAGAIQSAESNWWGDASGPSGTGPGTGDVITGANVDFTPWLYVGTNTAIACGFSPAPERIDVTTAAACISTATPCVAFDVTIARTTMTDVRGFSVPVQLSPNLQLCNGTSSIAEGAYLSAAGATSFNVIDHGGGAYTVDGVILGAPCGATARAGTLFTLQLSKAPGPDGLGTVTIGAPTLRDCDNVPVAAAAGPPSTITIDSSGLPACGLSGLPEQVAVTTGDTLISTATPTATFDVTIARTTPANVRGFSVPVHLSPNLRLCAGASSITEGTYLSDAGATYFTVVDQGGGEYTVDAVILGQPCGVTAVTGTLFSLHVTQAAGLDGAGTVTVGAPRLRDCDNAAVAAAAGIPATITIDTTPPPAMGDVAASQEATDNDADGTTRIIVTFTTPGDAAAVEVYRAGFGNYPEYDDAGGAEPAPPAYPPGAPWTLTGVTASGQADEVAERDLWYYAVFTKDACGNVSAVSNRTGGTLNYHLGDVSNGLVAGQGNNVVLTEDISLLGSHYPALLVPGDPFAFLDVGPTSDLSVNGRPTTDNRVDFEDLIILALNYSVVSAPLAAVPADPPARNTLSIEVPALPEAGSTFDVPLRFTGRGDVQALSLALAWDPAVVEPAGVAPGELLARQARGSIFLPAGAGVLDLALLGEGAGLAGAGDLARVTFRVLGPGDPAIAIARVVARDGANRPVSFDAEAPGAPAPAPPLRTAFGAVAPNPSPGGMLVEFSLATAGRAGLAVFDLSGRRVRTLLDEPLEPGARRIGWDGRDAAGVSVPPGFYVLRLEAAGTTATRRIMIVR